ncbi:MAG TPA: hypothetical protein VK116_18960 [Planctomycetota bacterium]|nr:hypothetical protein [Planctomycetota bacterium]
MEALALADFDLDVALDALETDDVVAEAKSHLGVKVAFTDLHLFDKDSVRRAEIAKDHVFGTAFELGVDAAHSRIVQHDIGDLAPAECDFLFNDFEDETCIGALEHDEPAPR